MGAILGTFLLGMWLGGGRVVYASWKPGDTRWPFVCQAGAGVVALPALVQSMWLQGSAKQPLFAWEFMAPPLSPGQFVSRAYAERLTSTDPDIEADFFFDKPPLRQFRSDQVSLWHRRLGRWFEIGTLYTMLAGMLNVLVIYDRRRSFQEAESLKPRPKWLAGCGWLGADSRWPRPKATNRKVRNVERVERWSDLRGCSFRVSSLRRPSAGYVG